MFRLAREQLVRIRVLSDDVFYSEAVKFANDHCQNRFPKAAQVHGMLQFSQSWIEWKRFTEHQSKREQHDDKEFYAALVKWNNELVKRLDPFGLVPEGLSKAQRRSYSDLICGELAREFAHHLAAEIQLRAERKY